MTKSTKPGALVYCQDAFRTTNGKTAHGLVRRSERYRVLSVIDSSCAGEDAGAILDGRSCGIPIVLSLEKALLDAKVRGLEPTHFIMGLAPDGGRLNERDREVVARALAAGLHLVSGLHDFFGDDKRFTALASRYGVTITDIRRPPERNALHFFSGDIDRVESIRVALLGTDSAVGKRTTAWMLVDEARARGRKCELIGTGQTSILQGAKYSLVLDSLVNDFVSGEIEHAILRAWQEERPELLVLEGQGSLLNPAYPGGFELLAAGRPQAVILQHAPARLEYDGFPGFPLHTIERQIRAVEVISDRPVVAIAVNRAGIETRELPRVKAELQEQTGLPVVEPISDGVGPLFDALAPWLAGGAS